MGRPSSGGLGVGRPKVVVDGRSWGRNGVVVVATLERCWAMSGRPVKGPRSQEGGGDALFGAGSKRLQGRITETVGKIVPTFVANHGLPFLLWQPRLLLAGGGVLGEVAGWQGKVAVGLCDVEALKASWTGAKGRPA